jgi:hypothetical protein
VQAGHLGWLETRRHRLDALALAGQQQARVPVHSSETPLCAYAAIGRAVVCSART